jgi:hypothetical protein
MGRPCRTHGREEERIEGFDGKSIRKETTRKKDNIEECRLLGYGPV